MKKYQFALNQHAIVSTTDTYGNITEVNDKFCEVSGYSRTELIGKNHHIINSGYQNKTFFSELWGNIRSGKIWHGEIKNKKKDGSFYWVNQTIVPFLNVKKECYEYVSICSDITPQKNQQKQLQDSRYFMEKVTDTMAQGVYVLDVDGLCTFWNNEAEKILGWTEKELKNKNLHEIIHYQDKNGFKILKEDCPTLKCILNKQTYSSETEFFTSKKGHILPIKITSVPLLENNHLMGSVAVFNDISERRENELLLNEAMVKAQQANQAKSDFLANMSHEIRTPMNGIIGMTDLALDTNLTEEQRSYLEIVKESSCALLAIINDILDFSKIEAGKVILDKTGFNLEKLIEEILLTSKQKVQGKKINIVSDITVHSQIPTYLIGDPFRLNQVLTNLLDNAIKFTTEGEVKLSIFLEEKSTHQCCLLFTVADTGIGITEDKKMTVFESFLQADSSVLRKFGGTGLGLSISKQIVELMGGRIWLESENNVGSTFSFTSYFEYNESDKQINLEQAVTNFYDLESDDKVELLTFPIKKEIKKMTEKVMDKKLMVCNWDVVVKRLGGTDILKIVIEIFLEEQHGYLENIKNALALKDITQLKNELHTLKGVCSTIGADQVESLIKTAEMVMTDDDGLIKVVAIISEIETNIEALNLFLNNKLKE
ncbi:MAG: PAS domain S-box protein [Methylococcales bacterium]|nr:PAS domain S-box protein [Methylococcales bacterium]